MAEVTQIVGALFILAAFAALQAGWVTGKSVAYLVCNMVGAAILAVLAFADDQFGFLLLEGTWTAISAWSLLMRLKPHRDALAAAGDFTSDR